jgi:hypothetical protein
MSLNRHAARRDKNERSIIAALRAVGCDVWQLSGRGLGDLLVCHRGVLYCAEIKSHTGRLTAQQGQFPIWRSAAEALEAIGVVTTDCPPCGDRDHVAR